MSELTLFLLCSPELVDFTNCPLGSILIYPQGYQNTFNYVNNLQTATPYTFTFAWTFNSAVRIIVIYAEQNNYKTF